MQIAYHIGVNCTDEERLLRSLMRSADLLSRANVALPGPGRYRKLMRETVEGLAQGPAPQGIRDVLIDAITEMADARRMVLSNAAFLTQPNRIFEDGQFYGVAAFKMQALRQMFPHDDLTVFMAIRNPATFVPAVFAQARAQTISGYLGDVDPRTILWSDLIARLRAAQPDIPVVVWCNEDTALIWNELLHLLAGLPADVPMEGAHDLLETIMAPEGMSRFRTYLATHPPVSDLHLRRIIGAFLDKYAIPAEIEEEIDIPGWDVDLVDDLTEIYEEDLPRIMAIPGVTFVQA